MFSRRGPILIVISLLLAVAAAWVANRWLIAKSASANATPDTVAVMSAAIDIPLGAKIEARHLATVKMLAETAPDSAYLDAASVEGKIALAEIMKGEILHKARFADQGGGSALAAVPSAGRGTPCRDMATTTVSGSAWPRSRPTVTPAGWCCTSAIPTTPASRTRSVRSGHAQGGA